MLKVWLFKCHGNIDVVVVPSYVSSSVNIIVTRGMPFLNILRQFRVCVHALLVKKRTPPPSVKAGYGPGAALTQSDVRPCM